MYRGKRLDFLRRNDPDSGSRVCGRSALSAPVGAPLSYGFTIAQTHPARGARPGRAHGSLQTAARLPISTS